jgi:hypothetical protein
VKKNFSQAQNRDAKLREFERATAITAESVAQSRVAAHIIATVTAIEVDGALGPMHQAVEELRANGGRDHLDANLWAQRDKS